MHFAWLTGYSGTALSYDSKKEFEKPWQGYMPAKLLAALFLDQTSHWSCLQKNAPILFKKKMQHSPAPHLDEGKMCMSYQAYRDTYFLLIIV